MELGKLKRGMKRPPLEQVQTAILWLLSNEGEADEAGACLALAEWIRVRWVNELVYEYSRPLGTGSDAVHRWLKEAGVDWTGYEAALVKAHREDFERRMAKRKT